MAWRFRPETFRLRSLLGNVPDANLADWPVAYAELEPFYEKAEYELGVSGDENPYGPPRRKPLPLPPVNENREAGKYTEDRSHSLLSSEQLIKTLI